MTHCSEHKQFEYDCIDCADALDKKRKEYGAEILTDANREAKRSTTMKITRKSPLTGEENTLDLPISSNQYCNWEEGELIQNAMPNLSADQREFVINGFMPGEFEKYFGPENEEE